MAVYEAWRPRSPLRDLEVMEPPTRKGGVGVGLKGGHGDRERPDVH